MDISNPITCAFNFSMESADSDNDFQKSKLITTKLFCLFIDILKKEMPKNFHHVRVSQQQQKLMLRLKLR